MNLLRILDCPRLESIRQWPQQWVAFLLAALLWCGISQANPIVHPWRAAPKIVPAGENFQVMLQAVAGEDIIGITLKGPFQEINIPAGKIQTTRGDFSYDPLVDGKYTMQIDVPVPPGSPADIYDLAIQTNQRLVVSKHSVNVISKYSKRYAIVHITDVHVTRNWVGDLKIGHPPELEHLKKIMEVVNIIGPDIVVQTGDNIVNFNRSLDQADPGIACKWKCSYEGTESYPGIHGFDAPVFTIAGNHDYFGVEKADKVRQYIKYNGLRTYGVAYGTGRILAYDDSLGPHRDTNDVKRQFNTLEAFLDKEGKGEFRILMHHQPKLAPVGFLDKHKIQLDLVGHTHRNKEYSVGATPTQVLVTKNAGIALIERDPGWFRVLTIEDGKIISNEALRYGNNATQTPLLKLDFNKSNDGSVAANTATITNGFDLAFPSCKVRFVMEKGSYNVTGGEIEQTFSTNQISVYDVRVPVSAHGKATVTIEAQSASAPGSTTGNTANQR